MNQSEEIKMLRRKLSPMEDPEFTEFLRPKLKDLKLKPVIFRKKRHYVMRPSEVAEQLEIEPTIHNLTNIGRSLQALCWERSAKNGILIFVIPCEEWQVVLS